MHQLALSALTHGRLYNSLDTTFGWHMNLVFITFSSITLSLGFDIGAPSCWQQHSMCDTVSTLGGVKVAVSLPRPLADAVHHTSPPALSERRELLFKRGTEHHCH